VSLQAAPLRAAPRPVPWHWEDPWRWPRIGAGTLLLAGLALAIGVLEPAYLALAVGGVTVAVLVVLRPIAAIPILLLVIPFGALAPIDLGDASLSVTEPLVALLGLAWAANAVRERRLYLAGGSMVVAILAFAALAAFSITYALSVPLAVKETLKWVELLVVAWVVADIGASRRSVSMLLAALFVAATSEALWGIAQAASNSGPSAFELGGSLRAFGTFDQPNPFAGYLSTVLPLATTVALLRSASRLLRRLAGATALCTAGGILLSQSRGAWLGVAFAAVVLLVLWSHRTRMLLAPLAAAAVLVLLLAASGLVSASSLDRLSQTVEYFGVFDVRNVELTDDNWAVVERMAHWQAGWSMFYDHPWLGVGAGNYPEAYPDYFLESWVDPLGHAHNYYLNTAAELGVVGLSALLAFLWLVFRTVLRTYRAAVRSQAPDSDFWRAVLAGILGGLVVFCTHNMFDNLFVHSVNVQIGLFVGIILVAVRHVRPPASLSAHARVA
jgi:O-antigen ligase